MFDIPYDVIRTMYLDNKTTTIIWWLACLCGWYIIIYRFNYGYDLQQDVKGPSG